jgi:hypothetical protein
VSRKTSEGGSRKKIGCLSADDRRREFRFSAADKRSFSCEADAALIFFVTFLYQDKKVNNNFSFYLFGVPK